MALRDPPRGRVRRLRHGTRAPPSRHRSDAIGRRARHRDPARPARSAAPPLDGRLDVLGLRLDRRGGRREPVRRSAVGLPPEPRRAVPRRRLARPDDGVRPRVHVALGAGRARVGRLVRRRGVALQGARRRGDPRRRRCGRAGRSATGPRRRLRRLEPRARRPRRRRGPQRRPRRRARRPRGRARGPAPARPRRSGVGARGVREVGPARLPRARGARRPRARERGRRSGHRASRRSCSASLGTWRYGLDWLRVRRPARGQRRPRDELRACPSRLEQLGVPHGAAFALGADDRGASGCSSSRGGAPAASHGSAAPRASSSRRPPTSPSGTSPGRSRSRRRTRTASRGSRRSRSRRTCSRRRSRSRRGAGARGSRPRRTPARTDPTPGCARAPQRTSPARTAWSR